MQKILVAGATGQLGRHIVTELNKRGYAIRAIARHPKKLSGSAVDEIVAADLTRPGTLKDVCQGIDQVISCAGASMNIDDFSDRKSFYEVDYHGNLNLLEEAKKAQIRKFIYVSLVYADKLRHVEYADAHEKFIESLRASGIPNTIIRPTGFFSFNLEVLKFADKGRGLLLGSGDCRTNPIHESDVARACVDALERYHGEVVIGGPDLFTRREITELAFAALHRKSSVMSISPGLFKFLISPLRLFNRRIYALMDFGIAVTQIDVIAPQVDGQRLTNYFEEQAKMMRAEAQLQQT
jgi:uncharacterized protein YbjT (DUF2867 family)